MSVILDTSIMIGLQRGDQRVKKEIESLSRIFPATPLITFLNIFEYIVGISRLTKRKAQAMELLENFDIVNTTAKTAEVMASLRLKYDKRGMRLSLSDLLIAGLAVENDMVLVTSDKDFGVIKELKVKFVA